MRRGSSLAARTPGGPLVPVRRGSTQVDARNVKTMTETTLTGAGPGVRRTIERTPGRTPLIGSYGERCRTFTWDEARRWLDGMPGGSLKIAYEAVDGHASAGLADHVALRFLDRTPTTQKLTYAELRGPNGEAP